LTILIIKTPQKAAKIPSILKVGRINETINKSTILIMIVKNPNVKIIKGNDSNFMTGRMKVFTTPRRAPAMT
jgi:hypothetical protein